MLITAIGRDIASLHLRARVGGELLLAPFHADGDGERAGRQFRDFTRGAAAHTLDAGLGAVRVAHEVRRLQLRHDLRCVRPEEVHGAAVEERQEFGVERSAIVVALGELGLAVKQGCVVVPADSGAFDAEHSARLLRRIGEVAVAVVDRAIPNQDIGSRSVARNRLHGRSRVVLTARLEDDRREREWTGRFAEANTAVVGRQIEERTAARQVELIGNRRRLNYGSLLVAAVGGFGIELCVIAQEHVRGAECRDALGVRQERYERRGIVAAATGAQWAVDRGRAIVGVERVATRAIGAR